MGKNAQIHLYLESEIHQALLRESEKHKISLSELCRQKIKQQTQLTRIEIILEKILKNLSKESER